MPATTSRKRSPKELARARVRASEYYAENTSEVLRKQKIRYRATLPMQLWKHARRRSKERGIEFKIAPSDVTIPDRCPVLGITLKVGRSKPLPESPTLDRLEPTAGYVPGNVAVISLKANTIKSNATIEELEAVVAYCRKMSTKQSGS